ncbi:helix-turn-helix transcriptional regulator [Paenibacillus sp. HJGM_3]|uniref:helix-turn-helix transcriptional regulator n=1 Tax=Paenibacillus sp. HJGM_3 TaxID=3379816 RepID=UPI00385836BB
MAKADNMLSVLWMLKAGRRRTAKELAEALEMNIRTVYRYIDALCASGVPIVSDSGHNGGYSLIQSFTDAPLIFDLHEQKALMHAALFAQEAGYPFGDDLNRAVAKLKLYTNEEQLDDINRHLRGFEVISPSSNEPLIAFLQVLEHAVADGRTLRMEYLKSYESAPEERSLDPYGLVYWKGRWYILGHCHLRSAIRSFRVDRIVTLTPTEETFQRPDDFSARSYFLNSLVRDKSEQDELMSIRIEGRRQVIQDLSHHWLFGHNVVERTETTIHITLDRNAVETLAPHLLIGYGRSIRVLEPVEMNVRLAEIAKDLAGYYAGL